MCAACTSPALRLMASDGQGLMGEQECGEQDEVNAALQPGGPTRDHGEDTTDHDRECEQHHLRGTKTEQQRPLQPD